MVIRYKLIVVQVRSSYWQCQCLADYHPLEHFERKHKKEFSLTVLTAVTYEGPLVSRHIAVSLFDKLAKKSSSLSTKVNFKV